MTTLAIDFGTSNTAAALMGPSGPYRIPIDPGQDTVPTAVFFDPDTKTTLYGHAANHALIAGREGRFMRALKSVLGTPLMREHRVIGGERRRLIDVVACFLQEIRTRAEAATGLSFEHALSGRPVRFHTSDDARNAQAEVDLRDAYQGAGFRSVDFMYEPEAAARTARTLREGATGLVIDIGGGTSDFSIFTQISSGTEIIASHGIRLGGTDFDRHLSIAHVMPLLGFGCALRDPLGSGTHKPPVALFQDLATWQKIAFLYTAESRRQADELARLSVDPRPFARLQNVLEYETGHDIAFAVEAAKIRANTADTNIDLNIIERGLSTPLTTATLAENLSNQIATITRAAGDTLTQAGLTPDAVDTLVFVGGSALLTPLTDAMTTLFPAAAQERASAFTAVVDGLAMAAR